jgi:hypothetical protein
MKSVLFKFYDFVLRLAHPILFDTKTAIRVPSLSLWKSAVLSPILGLSLKVERYKFRFFIFYKFPGVRTCGRTAILVI